MHTITTTELRTKTKQLTKLLEAGHTVKLIHRSKIIASLLPTNVDESEDKKEKEEPKVFTREAAERMAEYARNNHLPKLTDEEIEQRYRQAMEKKHGKHLS